MVTLCGAADDNAWDNYVRSAPHASSYHLSAWRRIIQECFGHRTYYLMSENAAGHINGVLPVVRLKSRLFGDFMVSLPYVNYGGPCADDESVADELIAECVRIAARERIDHVELRADASTDFGLRMRSAKVSMRLSLPDSADALWKSFPSKLRSQIKRAQQEDMTVQIGREALLDSFYDVFAANMRDLGTPVYSKGFFGKILRELPDSSCICAVYLGQTPVAAGFLVSFRDAIEIPWASSLRRYSRLSPNMLLYWSVLKHACESGHKLFDFGRSSPDSGPYRFKAQWGASPISLNWHYWVRDGNELPDLSPRNPKYQLAIRMWQRLPVTLTKLIGPPIVRNLP
jgi:serine/alanine adding enzyme